MAYSGGDCNTCNIGYYTSSTTLDGENQCEGEQYFMEVNTFLGCSHKYQKKKIIEGVAKVF